MCCLVIITQPLCTNLPLWLLFLGTVKHHYRSSQFTQVLTRFVIYHRQLFTAHTTSHKICHISYAGLNSKYRFSKDLSYSIGSSSQHIQVLTRFVIYHRQVFISHISSHKTFHTSGEGLHNIYIIQVLTRTFI